MAEKKVRMIIAADTVVEDEKTASTGETVNPGARTSIREEVGEMPSGGYDVPHISMPEEALRGEDGQQVPKNKIPSAIRRYMIKLFRGKVLDIGADNKVYISKGGIEEFSFPAKRLDGEIKTAKMTAGANLDTTLEPAVFLKNTPDDGRHPKATGGWDNFYVMFETDTGLYSGVVKTMVTERGREFYDITEIQEEGAPSTRGDNGASPPPAKTETPSINSIPQTPPGVNPAGVVETAPQTPVANSQTLGNLDGEQAGTRKGVTQDEQAGTVRVRDGGLRADGAGAALEAGAVAKGTVADLPRADRRGPADAGAGALKVGGQISSYELGVTTGVRGDALYRVTGGNTEDLTEARRLAAGRGLELVAFTGGNLHIRVYDRAGKPTVVEARAYINGNKLYVRADHAEFTALQLYRHEEYHDRESHGEVDTRQTMEAVREILGDELTAKLEAMYSRATGGLEGLELWKEIAADQYAGMNVFSGAFGAEDIEALQTQVGAQTDAQLAAKTETAAATDRRTGPPEGKFSRESDEGYSTDRMAWAVADGVLTRREQAAFWETIANLSKRGYYTPKSKSGEYIVDLGSKLVFTDGDFKAPSISRVIEFDDTAETVMSEFKERIYDEERRTGQHEESLRLVEIYKGEGYVSERANPGVRAHGRKARGGEGRNRSWNFEGPEGEDVKPSTSREGDQTFVQELRDLQHDVDVGTLTVEAARERLDAMIEKYGAIKPGENPAREIAVPKRTSKDKKVSQTVRTILEAEATPDVVVPTLEDLTANGEFSYEAYTDKAAMKDAEIKLKRKGWDKTLAAWTADVTKGVVSKENTSMGWLLYNNAVNDGNVQTALDILDLMVKHQRNAAQAVQATRILKKMSPEAQLYNIQRSVWDLQEELNRRYGDKKSPKLKIPEDLAEDFLTAGTQDERDRVLHEIGRAIGRQVPSTLGDKWNAWRYLAMLGNPRTHIRNIVGNAGFMPVVAAKDLTATAIETVVGRVSGGRLERTKGAVGLGKGGRALLKAAWGDYANVRAQALGEGKYSDRAVVDKDVEAGRRIFKSRVLEGARRGNGALLDLEDAWFSQPHYAYALAQFCKANGISAEALAAASEGLQADGAHDTMGETEHFLKEAWADGEQREETRRDFKRRCASEGYEFVETAGAACGFRRVRYASESGYRGRIAPAAQIQRELKALGIDAVVVDGPVLQNKNGITCAKGVQEAVTASRNYIFISKDTTLPARNAAGHEAFHLWGGSAARDAYIGIVEGNLRFTSREFLEYQSKIANAYLGGEADLSDSKQTNRLFEELFAYISGDIHEGGHEDILRPMFQNFDAVKAAWDALVRENTRGVSKREAERPRAGREIEVDDALLAKARAYAVREAQKATYRDTNAFSQWASSIGRPGKDANVVKKVIGVAMEGVLPFRKTPANILARGVEYSPIGLVKSLSVDLAQVARDKMTGAEAIDHISAGLTGTGLMLLGVFLAAQGLVRGGGGDDDKKKEFEELQGHQDYALEVGGTSVTLDWLAPEALPFFIGVNLYEQTQGDWEDVKMEDVLSAAGSVTEPLLEMSCLQSLNDLVETVQYGDTDGVVSIAASAATSYLTQALPTLLGQLERSGEGERMTTYTDKNKFITPDMQYTVGRASARIPGMDYGQVPFIDAWGRAEDTGSLPERIVNNFLNPAYTDQIDTSAMEDELLRLYEATGDGGVFPSRASKYFNVNGKRKDLTAEEYVTYATVAGTEARRLVTDLTASREYREMDNDERADAVEYAYQLAKKTGQGAVAEVDEDSWMTKAREAKKKYDIDEDTYISLKAKTRGIEGLKDQDGETIANSKGLQIMETVYDAPGLNDKQRQAMFEYLGVGKSVRHYNKAKVHEELFKMRRK